MDPIKNFLYKMTFLILPFEETSDQKIWLSYFNKILFNGEILNFYSKVKCFERSSLPAYLFPKKKMVESNIVKGFGSNEKGKNEISIITNGDIYKTSSNVSESSSCNCGSSMEEPLYKHVYRYG